MAGSGELTFSASLDPRLGWLIVSVQVGELVEDRFLSMALSTLTAQSAISVPTRNLLLPTGHLTTLPTREDRYVLRDLQIDGQSIPDLEVGISGLATRAGVSGLLGLNFFQQFVDVHVHLPTLELRLTDP